MSTDKIEDKDQTKQNVSKDELSEKQLDKATGGESVSFSFGKIKIDYTTQKGDGSTGN